MKIKKWRLGYTAAMIVAAGLIFLLDYSTPETSTYSLLYIGLVLLTIFHRSALFSLGVTIVVSVLTVVELFFNPPIDLQVVWTNESISLAGIWVAYLFAIKFKKNDLSENQHRERLDALFTYATEGMLIANASGEILIANPTCSSMLGYEPGELVGKKIEALIPDRFAERHVRHREKYNKTPSPRAMGTGLQLSARRKDGTEIPVEISLSNFETGDGKFVIAFIIDITERRRNEELIRKEKEQAQRYLDIAPIIFLVLDTEGHVLLINQTGCQTIGLPESSLLGKNWFELLNTQDSVFLLESYKKIFTGKPNPLLSTWESRLRTQSGEIRIISWKNIILRDEKGTPYAVLTAGQDVTERNRQEEIIRNLNADLEQRVKSRTQELAETVTKLEQSNITLAVQIKEREAVEERLRASREELRQALSKEKELSELKSRFVTMASHEFRTPLSTILSSASLAGKYNTPEDEEKRIKHLDRIKSSVNNLTSILNDFLSLGKLEEGKIQCSPSEFDLLALSHDLVSEMKEMTKKGQVVSYRHEGRTSKVVLDKNLTRNICINLLSNAIKYSDEGKPILFATSVTADKVVLRVTDHGIGIPQEEQAHIFERFFRANNATNIQGTGLGLNIVKKYAELMDGTIRFESVSGEGTTFIVELPYNLPNEPNLK